MSVGANTEVSTCWNCSYKLQANHLRCPRCGIATAAASARPTASAAPPTKIAAPKLGDKASRKAKAPRSRKAPAAPVAAPARGEIIPPRPPAPGLLARIGSGAGKGLVQSFGMARKLGAVTVTGSKQVAGTAAKLVSGTASTVQRGTALVVRKEPRRGRGSGIDVDALRRENAKTLADVAELLLRETREENAALRERLERLEAIIAARDVTPVPAPAATKPARKSASPAAGAAGPKPAARRPAAGKEAPRPAKETPPAPSVVTAPAPTAAGKTPRKAPARAGSTRKPAVKAAAMPAEAATPAVESMAMAAAPAPVVNGTIIGANATDRRTATRARPAKRPSATVN